MHTCLYEDPQEKYNSIQINDIGKASNESMLLYENGHVFISWDN